MAVQTLTATATDQATTGAVFTGWGLLSIQDIGTSMVAFERSHDSGTTWEHIKTFIRNVELNFYAPGSATEYRLRATYFDTSPGIKLRLEN